MRCLCRGRLNKNGLFTPGGLLFVVIPPRALVGLSDNSLEVRALALTAACVARTVRLGQGEEARDKSER